MKRLKDMTLEYEPFRLEGVQYATREEKIATTNSSRKNEEAGSKQKWCSVVDVSGGESNVWADLLTYKERTILHRNLEC